MVFSSMTFVPLFLPLVLGLYFAFKSPKARNGVLLAFSLLFYAWGEPKWIFVMLLTVMAAMPSAAMVSMLSELYDVNPGYASQAVGTTTLLSTLTLPIVLYVAQIVVG